MQDNRLRIEISLLKEMLEENEVAKTDWNDKRFQKENFQIKNGASTESLLNTLKNKSYIYIVSYNSYNKSYI